MSISHNPSLTSRHTMKLRRVADGTIVERGVWDAKIMADTADYEFADAGELSVREQVEALGPEEISRRLHVLGAQASTPGDNVVALVALVEAGTVEL